MKELSAFRAWLLFVVCGRVFGIYCGFFAVHLIRDNMYPLGKSEVTDLYGRLFTIWTTCSLTAVSTLIAYPRSKPLYFVTFMIFVFTLLHFQSEASIFGTSTVFNILLIYLFAGGSIIYMGLRVLLGLAFASDTTNSNKMK